MIPFKGRSTLKQYMPQKPVRRGIKILALADAMNGFVSMFQVHTGKQANTAEKGLGANVTTLTKLYTNTFRHVHFDNFTGVGLLLDLRESGLYGCDTIRTKRKGFPQQLKPIVTNLDVGTVQSFRTDLCNAGSICFLNTCSLTVGSQLLAASVSFVFLACRFLY